MRTPAGETFSFAGEYYQLTDSPALPKPVQSPRPPLILGGAGKARGAALAASYADEYNVAFRDLADTGAVFDRVRAAAATTGRELVYSVAQVVCVGRNAAELTRRAAAIGRDIDDLRAHGIAGTPDEAATRIARVRRAGSDPDLPSSARPARFRASRAAGRTRRAGALTDGATQHQCGRQSQPRSSATRTASTRLRTPVFAIAADR